MKKVAVLGPKGTYSDVAKDNYLNSINEEYETIYYPSIIKAINAIDDNTIAIVPFENSLDGFILESLDKMISNKLNVVKVNYKYVDADNYVYMRGNDIMIAVGKGLSRTIEIEDHGLNDDDKFCNKLKAGDCISVKDDVLTIRMDGEPKIYLRKSIGEMIYVSSYLFLFLILLALF